MADKGVEIIAELDALHEENERVRRERAANTAQVDSWLPRKREEN